MLTLFLYGELLFFLFFFLGSLSYRSRGSFSYTCCAGLMFSWGGFVTHPKRPSFICGEFLLHTLYWLLFIQGVVLHIPCCLFKKQFFYLGSFSYTSRVCFFFLFFWGVPLTHPVLASFLSGEFLLHIPCWV